MLIEFSLPSDPKKTIKLHEATVNDALDFSSVDPSLEEMATTLFLNTIQEKDTFVDSKTWTGEDRRYGLFRYYLETTRDVAIPLSYNCSICGKQHTQDIHLSKILNTYRPMDGEPFREFVHEGHNIIVAPLTGADLEKLEAYHYDLATSEDVDLDTLSSEERRDLEKMLRLKRQRITLCTILACLDMPYLDKNGTKESRAEKVQDAIMKMSVSEFKEFRDKIEGALKGLQHGLQCSYVDGRLCIEIPDVKCDTYPDKPGILLRYPFRFSQVIPVF